MPVNTEEIHTIVDNIWASLFGLELRPSEADLHPARNERFLTGCVQITGGWEGAVIVECPLALARELAEAMFGMDPGTAETEEIHDALGELANMAGGNIKALLPGPSQLSLPAVAEGVDYSLSVPGSSVLRQVGFESAGQPLVVTVLMRDGSGSMVE